ncbi:MAG: precorrin-2 C(20)-methyltransferase [Anaerovoracaceae bacterium]|jgi:precorrin-2/cobalt-factor-2 C20-methyltransferase
MEKEQTQKKVKGKLFGLGVGPGDPELMTLKCARLIKECEIIAYPESGKDVATALGIARSAVPEIDQKKLLSVSMPMIRDADLLAESHDKAADKIIEKLEEGKDVAFLTLGDPSIYSTYIYVHDRVLNQGYDAEIIPGIPSFCAVAAKLNEGLTEAHEALHIIPGSYEGVKEALELKGTRVLMKSGKAIAGIKKLIMEMENPPQAKMVERCGMEGERIFYNLEDIDEKAGYFSILVLKDQ